MCLLGYIDQFIATVIESLDTILNAVQFNLHSGDQYRFALPQL